MMTMNALILIGALIVVSLSLSFQARPKDNLWAPSRMGLQASAVSPR